MHKAEGQFLTHHTGIGRNGVETARKVGVADVKRVTSGNVWLGRMSALLLVAAGLAGCANLAADYDPASATARRASERWAALIAGDLDTAYTYLSPGYRETVTLAAYKSRVRPGLWKKAEVKSVKCEQSVCRVTMSIVYDHKMMKNVQTDLFESWLVENGNVWVVLEK